MTDSTPAEPPLLTALEFGVGYAASFAGLLLARCGAEVAKIESPAVASLRRPASGDPAGEDSGPLFSYLNAGKLSVEVLAGSGDSERLLMRLWQWADVVIVDQPWLGQQMVRDLLGAPGPAVVAAISPFGLSGPYASRPANDASVFAMAGESSMLPGGLGYALYPDAPPLIAGGHVADADTGVIAASICLAGGIAAGDAAAPLLFDVSALECETSLNRWLVSHYDATGWVESRATRAYAYAGLVRCRDGYVMMQPTTDGHWTGLVAAMGNPAWAACDDWATQDGRSQDGAEISARLAAWARGQTKAELLAIGLVHEVPIAPFLDVPEVVECEQFRSRNYFMPYQAAHESGREREVPGLPFHAEPAGEQQRRRAPLLGEDTPRMRARLWA